MTSFFVFPPFDVYFPSACCLVRLVDVLASALTANPYPSLLLAFSWHFTSLWGGLG